MDDGQRYTIGELAQRSGLSVKTIRFYSDSGVVPPTHRTPAGYRLYDVTAVARLELVRTLRELGAGLDEVRRVLAAETTVHRLAEVHLDLLEDQMRLLRTRRAVLRAVVKSQRTTEEVKLMHKLAQLSDAERNRLIDEFWDATTADLNINPKFAEWMRSAKPELPDDPSSEQVEAWIELAELASDQDFRRVTRELWRQQAERREAGHDPADQTPEQARRWWTLQDEVNAAQESGAAADSTQGRALAERASVMFAEQWGTADTPAMRAELAHELERSHDPRMSRYWELLATINGWPQHPTKEAGMHWLAAAVRASTS